MVIGPDCTTFIDNAGIMTYYAVQHLTPEEDIVYSENERLDKEREENDRRVRAKA